MRVLSPASFRSLFAAGFLLAGCATLGGANYYSLEQEWQMGQQIEQQLRQELPLTNDAQLNRYISDMGQRMVARTNMARLPWRFHVVRDGEINAFNVPGGMVYVNTGLIAQSGSAAELAGAVAHEIAHGVLRHGTQRLSAASETNAIAGAVLGGNPGVATQIAAQIAAQGAFASFSRSDEREADQMGVQLMAAAGYDPEGLAMLLNRLAQQEQGGGGIAFFRSHPLSAERVQNVRQAAARVDRRGLNMNDAQFSSVQRRAAGLR